MLNLNQSAKPSPSLFGAPETPQRSRLETEPSAESAQSAPVAQGRGKNEDVSAAVGFWTAPTTGGTQLAPGLRQRFEGSLGTSLADVRVHSDARAAQAAQRVSARAFAHGRDVFVDPQEVDLDSPDGERLLAHEVAHTVQQRGQPQGAVQKQAKISETGDPHEAEADTAAEAMLEGCPAQVSQIGDTQSAQIQCEKKDKKPKHKKKQSTDSNQKNADDESPVTEADWQKFLERCQKCNTLLDLADRTFSAWLSSVTVAYGDAWKEHTGVLNDQSAHERLVNDMILNAVFAFLPGGVGGLIGKALKDAKAGDFIVDGLKDLTKWTLRGTGPVALTGGGPPSVGPSSSGLKAFPDDPLKWQSLTNLRTKSELALATKELLRWQGAAINRDKDFNPKIDPEQALKSCLTIHGTSLLTLQPVDIGSTTRKIEKGFWKGWLEQYGYRLSLQTMGCTMYTATENAGKKIRARCEELGLPIDTYTEKARSRVEAEAKKKNEQLGFPYCYPMMF